MKTCGELLSELLAAYGIDTAFGIPGTHTIELYRGLRRAHIRHISPRHEQGAGYMADGYARVTGRPAACFTISGPGALNISAAMAQALQDSVPMIVISADNATYQTGLGEGRLHEFDNIHEVMRRCSRWAYKVARPDELPRVLGRAMAVCLSGRPGPVHLTVPLDVMTADASHVEAKIWPLPSRPAADRNALRQAAILLNSAVAPVVAIGGGAVDAQAEIVTLIEALDAPVTETQNAKGILPVVHPLRVGGSPSDPMVQALLRDSDVVLAIGTEFGETDYDFTLSDAFSLGRGKLIRIDIDMAMLSSSQQADVLIWADARLAIRDLLPLLDRIPKRADTGPDRAAKARMKSADGQRAVYQKVLSIVADTLPGVILVADSTQPGYQAASLYNAHGPRSFFSAATGFGTLGYAVPAAIGAKIARPDRPVVAMVGDGGVQFCLAEWASAVEEKAPVITMIWNSSERNSYGEIARNFTDRGLAPLGCNILAPDFRKVAEGFGCTVLRVRNTSELEEALRAAWASRVPVVLDLVEGEFLGGIAG